MKAYLICSRCNETVEVKRYWWERPLACVFPHWLLWRLTRRAGWWFCLIPLANCESYNILCPECAKECIERLQRTIQMCGLTSEEAVKGLRLMLRALKGKSGNVAC